MSLQDLKNAYLDFLVGKQPGWRLDVDEGSHKMRLDQFIAKKLERVSRSRAAQLEVFDIDREIELKKSATVHEGQRIWVKRPFFEETIPQLNPTILSETEDFLVLNKPPFWSVHPTAHRFTHTITTWLKQQKIWATPVHRLDHETSGLLLCAKNKHAENALIDAFAQHTIQKTYLAIIEGVPNDFFWQNQTPLGFDHQSEVKIKMGKGNLSACTEFQLQKIYLNTDQQKRYALIKAMPKSGRQHQIRAHLMLSGYGLLGDKLYGKSEKFFLKSLEAPLTEDDFQILGHQRHCLHAFELSFDWGNLHYKFECPLAKDLWEILGKPTDLEYH
jgi:RluA family pseudouridine synthase